jgi:hypothetical protein
MRCKNLLRQPFDPVGDSPQGTEEGDAMKRYVIYGFHILVGGLFLATGSAKLAGVYIMVQAFDVVGLGQSFRIMAGSLEVIGGMCLLVPRTGVLGANLVACAVAGFLSSAIAHGISLASSPNPTSRPQFTIYRTTQTPSGGSRGEGVPRSNGVATNPRDIGSENYVWFSRSCG